MSACRISLGDPSGKMSSWKTEEERDFKNFDYSFRWWVELNGDRVKWRTFLKSIHSRQDDQKRNPNRVLMLGCLQQVLRLLIFVCY